MQIAVALKQNGVFFGVEQVVQQLSHLVTSHTRVLDLAVLHSCIRHDDFCQLLHLASKRCPVNILNFPFYKPF